MEKNLKLQTTKIKSINEDSKSIRFRISDDSVERYGEEVDTLPVFSKGDYLTKKYLARR